AIGTGAGQQQIPQIDESTDITGGQADSTPPNLEATDKRTVLCRQSSKPNMPSLSSLPDLNNILPLCLPGRHQCEPVISCHISLRVVLPSESLYTER
ncbi:hypothetical protein T265_13078, partial [Opisthorchis viverrini]